MMLRILAIGALLMCLGTSVMAMDNAAYGVAFNEAKASNSYDALLTEDLSGYQKGQILMYKGWGSTDEAVKVECFEAILALPEDPSPWYRGKAIVGLMQLGKYDATKGVQEVTEIVAQDCSKRTIEQILIPAIGLLEGEGKNKILLELLDNPKLYRAAKHILLALDKRKLGRENYLNLLEDLLFMIPATQENAESLGYIKSELEK